MSSEINDFFNQVSSNIAQQSGLRKLGIDFVNDTSASKYTYNFSWFGRPIIQFPQDIIALQEIIWEVKPNVVIETGIAHGGSLLFSAAMLTLLELCGEIVNGRVLGVDVDIRPHNRKAIEEHPLSNKVTMLEGSSIDSDIVRKVHEFVSAGDKVLLMLDSNHSHDHVLEELKLYSGLVTVGSYCIVYDTIIEDMPKGSFPNRPWDKGNNPKTAVWEFLSQCNDFKINQDIENKLLITVAPDGYLLKVK